MDYRLQASLSYKIADLVKESYCYWFKTPLEELWLYADEYCVCIDELVVPLVGIGFIHMEPWCR